MTPEWTTPPKLYLLVGSQPAKPYLLERETFRIGRHPECDVVFEEDRVSRFHASIVRREGQFLVKDGPPDQARASHNGTFLNGRKLDEKEPVRLKPGDQIRVCQYIFIFDSPVIRVDADDTTSTVLGSIELSSGSGTRVPIQVKPEQLLEAVLSISRDIGTTLDQAQLMDRTLECLFQLFPQAERGFILLKPERETEDLSPQPQAYRFRGDSPRQWKLSHSVMSRVMERGEAILSQNVQDDSRFREAGSLAESEVRTMICMPLLAARRMPIGMVQVDTSSPATPFTQHDLDLLAALTGPVSLAIENAQLHAKMMEYVALETELRAAQDVQKALLPVSRPNLADYEFWDHYEPARMIGGDYYDYLPLRGVEETGKGAGACLAVTIADVSGKGLAAALFMAKLATGARYQFLRERDPAKVVTTLNAEIEDARLPERFVTFLLAVLDTRTHRLTVVNAGHLKPLVRRAATGKVEPIFEPAVGFQPPLCVIEGFEYTAIETTIERGDVVFLMTDGVTEAMSARGEEFRERRVIEVLEAATGSANAVGMSVLYAVRQHVGAAAQSDDIALVCFRRV